VVVGVGVGDKSPPVGVTVGVGVFVGLAVTLIEIDGVTEGVTLTVGLTLILGVIVGVFVGVGVGETLSSYTTTFLDTVSLLQPVCLLTTNISYSIPVGEPGKGKTTPAVIWSRV